MSNTYQIDERSQMNVATLLPAAQRLAIQLLQRANDGSLGAGIEVKIIAGLRTYAEQADLYAQGRTRPGNIVTDAKAGFSWHNFGTAFDVGIFKDGQYLDDSPLYKRVGQIGLDLGLDWGGSWMSIVDEPHFQVRSQYNLAQARAFVADDQWKGMFA